jgi:Uma2 family endonuclease
MVDSIRTQMTSAEYWSLPETNQIEELIDGELVMTPPPLDAHQKSSIKTLAVCIQVITTGELRHAPTGIHFEDGYDFEPDIFWVAPENDHCVLAPDGRYWHGAPDLIIEILSPSTAYRDRGIKFETYEKHGVREYWLVDPEAAFAEIYRLDDGRFVRLGVFRAGQTFTSPVLGIDVKVDALLG